MNRAAVIWTWTGGTAIMFPLIAVTGSVWPVIAYAPFLVQVVFAWQRIAADSLSFRRNAHRRPVEWRAPARLPGMYWHGYVQVGQGATYEVIRQGNDVLWRWPDHDARWHEADTGFKRALEEHGTWMRVRPGTAAMRRISYLLGEYERKNER